MNPDARTVLFVREVPWETYYPISTRKLAGEFARDGWNVIWLNLPLPPWSSARGRSHIAQMQREYEQGGIFYEDGSVFAYTPKGWMPYSRRKPLDHPMLYRNMWRACRPALRQVLQRAHVPQPDALFLAHWAAGGIRHLFPGKPIIFHVTDNYVEYPAAPRATAEQLQRENYRIADHIIVTAPSLKALIAERYGAAPEKTTVVLHGVDLERFQEQPLPPALAERPRPRLVALGNTQKMDYPTLTALAQAFPDGTLAVLGPPCAELDALAAQFPNIYAPGPVKPEDVPAHLLAGDVGIITLGERFRETGADMNPMKLYEYAAAGLPVVSLPLPVLDTLNVPYWKITTPESAVNAVQEALAQRETVAQAMRAFAERNTWQQKYRQTAAVLADLQV